MTWVRSLIQVCFAACMHIACAEGIFYMHILKRESLKQLPDNLLFKLSSQWLILYKLFCLQTEKLKYWANDLFAVCRSAFTIDLQNYLLWNLMICSGVSSEALKACLRAKEAKLYTNVIWTLPSWFLLTWHNTVEIGMHNKNIYLYMQITIILLLCLITDMSGYL